MDAKTNLSIQKDMDLKNRLNQLKEKHGLTNQRIADGSGVPSGTVSGIFSGQTARPAFEDVVAILTFMGESIDEFCGIAQPQAHAGTVPADQPGTTVHHHHFALMPLHGDVKKITQDAITDVYSGEAYRIAHSNLKWWRAIAIALIALVIGWFTWDITHPKAGLIQYGSITPAITSGMTETEDLQIRL